MKYTRKLPEIDAHQWFKNGDHPNDNVWRPFEDTGKIPTEPREGAVVRYYRHPSVDGITICKECGFTIHDHGFLDNEYNYRVCPGDWIISQSNGKYSNISDKHFKLQYEEVK
jgi:hypothetical protein